jgi:hypothetical protein
MDRRVNVFDKLVLERISVTEKIHGYEGDCVKEYSYILIFSK